METNRMLELRQGRPRTGQQLWPGRMSKIRSNGDLQSWRGKTTGFITWNSCSYEYLARSQISCKLLKFNLRQIKSHPAHNKLDLTSKVSVFRLAATFSEKHFSKNVAIVIFKSFYKSENAFIPQQKVEIPDKFYVPLVLVSFSKNLSTYYSIILYNLYIYFAIVDRISKMSLNHCTCVCED